MYLSILLFLLLIFHRELLLFLQDLYYFSLVLSRRISGLYNNNLVKVPSFKKKRILFITFDNRKAEYIDKHNQNIREYCKKWDYDYKFIDQCNKNVYWCKLYLLKKYLRKKKYDYVVWLDSDTYIFNPSIRIDAILQRFDSDIFVGFDQHPLFDIGNAGVVAIRNSRIGRQYIRDCLKKNRKECYNKNGSLKGFWASSCYEQGTMNILILQKYSKKTTLLDKSIINNSNRCNKDTFLLHYYGGNNKDRVQCFN